MGLSNFSQQPHLNLKRLYGVTTTNTLPSFAAPIAGTTGTHQSTHPCRYCYSKVLLQGSTIRFAFRIMASQSCPVVYRNASMSVMRQ